MLVATRKVGIMPNLDLYCYKCKEYDPKIAAVCELKLHGKANPKYQGADEYCVYTEKIFELAQ